MINVVTVHWQTPKWIDVQLGYLDRNIDAPYRVFASVNGIDEALGDPRFHVAADLAGSHAEKLNELAAMVVEQSDPDDIVMFVDGDAFPVRPLVPWVNEVLAAHPLAAVRRDENLGDPQPHPCFCVTTARFWSEIGGDWRAGTPWVNDVGTEVADVGGALYDRLRELGTSWLPLLRTNTSNPHPLLFGVYGHRLYHHGAGFRRIPTRVDLHRQAGNRPSSERPSLGTLRSTVTDEPARLLHLRPRHAGVAVGALRRTVALRREARHGREVDRLADEMFARLVVDPRFFLQLDDAEVWPVARTAYLIMSHKNPAQVEALVSRILELSPAGEVVIHHDAHHDPEAERVRLFGGAPPPRVHVIEPRPVVWGDWSVVEATLRLLHFAVDELDAGWFVMLSGQDRPVRDLAVWERELEASGADGLVPARRLARRPVVGRKPSADDLNFVRYAFTWHAVEAPSTGPGGAAVEVARRISRYVQPVFKIEYAERRGAFMVGRRRRRRLPAGWSLYSGSQWMALDRRAVTTLLSCDPSVTSWFRSTWIPDQGFIHTVLYNSPDLSLRTDPLTYVVPHDSTKRAAWMVLRSDDAEAIARSGAAFARKFDPEVDARIIELVDAAVDASVRTTSRRGPGQSQ